MLGEGRGLVKICKETDRSEENLFKEPGQIRNQNHETPWPVSDVPTHAEEPG